MPDSAGDRGPQRVSGYDGSELRVWLITMGPGRAVWERFGHNAIRVLDTGTGSDISYNWGIFDFDQENFIPRFLKGEMLYMMAAFPTGPMLDYYARAGREVVFQELDLTPAEKLELREFVEWNALPENRDYRYDYFIDNCSTRVRDVLDRVLGGALHDRYGEAPTETSYRWHIRRLTRVDPLLFTGMDLLLGARGDRPISVWEEMFLPETIRRAVSGMTRTMEDGTERPIALEEELVLEARGIVEPRAPPSWLLYYLVIGAILGAGIAWAGARVAAGSRAAAWTLAVAGGAWSLLAGVAGTLLVAVLFTEHWAMAWNLNLLPFNPLHLALVVFVPMVALGGAGRGTDGDAESRGAVRARRLARAERVARIALLATAVGLVVALLPFQRFGIFMALALPVQAGIWWAMARVAEAEGAAGDGRRV
ncbi:MAG TPA: DUF4105 domain-containing protein [Longimicrobiales bacterium]|nr:DUF4105 domain-containing protein [Longimicrobiales bacterium]